MPDHVVVDTNVAATANGANEGAPVDCIAASALALQQVMRNGHLYLDNAGEIVSEYRANLRSTGEPGPGDAFLRWVLTHEWGSQRVTRVTITPKADLELGYEELPAPEDGTVYDPSDRKFLAVAAAHPRRPPILQSFDSKWWGWRAALEGIGVRICFLCREAIEAKYREKMQR